MNQSFVLKKALLSEKAYKDMEASIYTFLTDARATKDEIKKAVESQFSVNVVKVNVSTQSQKTKRISGTRKLTQVGGGKKARIYLQKGQNIAILSPKTEKKEKTLKASKVSKETNDNKEPKGLISRIKKSKTKEKSPK